MAFFEDLKTRGVVYGISDHSKLFTAREFKDELEDREKEIAKEKNEEDK